ncbi:hypothetical protein PVIIG_06309 [Plasmodium vivax India VII]|uniref:VIR protein n=1 Tax=Plasmodium vivax India VII TaxID=1077284 RepID=A0A0J9S1E2_PLAVI|nr:hypothetical protein PVIIG_06309 [Plasmodium vivax India VII]
MLDVLGLFINLLRIYLDCKCYLKLKNYFDYNGKFKGDDNLLKKIIEYAKTPSKHKVEKNEIFGNIKQRLNGDGVFTVQNPTECCRYINYWLNKEVQEKLNHLYTDSLFNIFEDFVKSYHIHKNPKKCKTGISYIDSSELQKMKTVYDLYYRYERLLNNIRLYNETPCSNLLLMSRTYDDSMRSHAKNDPDLFSRLKNLKKLIDDNNILGKYQCTEQIHFLEPDSYVPPQIKHSVEEKQAQIMPNIPSEPSGESPTLQSLVSTGVTRSSEGHELTESSKGKGEISLPEVEAMQEGRRLPENGSFQEQYELRGYREPSGVTRMLGRLRKPEELRHSTDSGYSRTLNLPNINILSPDTEDHASEVERESRSVPEIFFGTLQNSLSSIVKNVDPVPVVGVSGGMGALFLLFRVLEILNLHPLCTIHLNKN